MPLSPIDAIQILGKAQAHFVLSVHSQGRNKIDKAPASVHFRGNDGWWINRRTNERTSVSVVRATEWMAGSTRPSDKKPHVTITPNLGVIPGSIQARDNSFLVLDIDTGGHNAIDSIMEHLGVDIGFMPSVNSQDGDRGHLWLPIDPNEDWDSIDGDWRLPDNEGHKNGEIIYVNKWADTNVVDLVDTLKGVAECPVISVEIIRALKFSPTDQLPSVPAGTQAPRQVDPRYLQGYSTTEDFKDKKSSAYISAIEWVKNKNWAEGSRNNSLSQCLWHLLTNPESYPENSEEHNSILDAILLYARNAGLEESEISHTLERSREAASRKNVAGQSDSHPGRGRRRAQQQQPETAEYEYEIPVFLQRFPSINADLARLLYYRGSRFLTDGQKTIWVSLPNGTWEQVPTRGFTPVQRAYIHIWLEEARAESVQEITGQVDEEAAKELSDSFQRDTSYLRGFIESVWRIPGLTRSADRYRVELVNAEDFNNRRAFPVIPFQSDAEHESSEYAGLDLSELRVIDAEEMREYRVLASDGWHVAPRYWNGGDSPEDSAGIDQIKYLVETVWRNDNADILQMLGQAILFPIPRVMVVKGPPNIGKSSLFTLFSKVLGKGLIDFHPNSESLFRGQREYTFFEEIICTSMLAVYDEADKTDGRKIPDRILRDGTAPYHNIVMKGFNPINKSRTGMLVLMGNEWPMIDLTQTGIKRRLWTYELFHEEPMSEEDYFRCEQEDSLTWLFQAIVRQAHEVFVSRDAAEESGESYYIQQDEEAFISMEEYLKSDVGPQLSDYLERDTTIQRSDSLDTVAKGLWAKQISEIIEADLDFAELHKEIKRSFKGVVNKRFTRNTEKEYKYALKAKDGIDIPETEPEPVDVP